MFHCNISVTNHHKIPQILKLQFFIERGIKRRKIEKIVHEIVYKAFCSTYSFMALLANSSSPKPVRAAKCIS
jgi:hypothetical protein